MLGIRANTAENGATVIRSEWLTCIGAKEGILPDESVFRTFPLRSMSRLCIFPSLAVKWYSSLMFPSLDDPLDILANFVLWGWLSCFKVNVPLLATFPVETWTWTVVLPSRLISSKVIPGCWYQETAYKPTTMVYPLVLRVEYTYRVLWAMSVSANLIRAREASW